MYLSVDITCDSVVFLVGQFGFDPLETSDELGVLESEGKDAVS